MTKRVFSFKEGDAPTGNGGWRKWQRRELESNAFWYHKVIAKGNVNPGQLLYECQKTSLNVEFPSVCYCASDCFPRGI